MELKKDIYIFNDIKYEAKDVAIRIEEVNNMVKANQFEKRIDKLLSVISSFSVNHILKICDISETDSSKTDGKHIWLMLPMDFIFLSKNKIYSSFIALGMHEIEHVLSTSQDVAQIYREDVAKDIFPSLNRNQSDNIAHYIFNAVEDGRIERRAANRSRGYAKILKWFRFLFYYNRGIEKPESNEDTPLKQLSDVLWAVCTIATYGKFPRNWFEFYDDNSDETLLVKKCIPFIEDAVASEYCRKCAENCKEICFILKDFIVKRLPKIPKDLEDLLKELISSADPKLIEDIASNDGDYVGNIISIREDLETHDSQENKTDKNNSSNKLNDDAEEFGEIELRKDIKQEKNKDNNYVPSEEELKSLGEEGSMSDYYSINYKNQPKKSYIVEQKLQEIGKKLNKNLKPIFVYQKQAYSYNRKKGLIDSSNLSKVIIKESDIFKKKNKIKKPSVAVYSLIDASGSMSGPKWNDAMDTSTIIEIGLKKLVPFKIGTFHTLGNKTEIDIVKDFNNISSDEYTQYYRMHNFAGGSNRDALAIRIACADLIKRPEKTKILIITSDGYPSSYCLKYKNAKDDVKQAVKEARKYGIYVFGIYIGNNNHKAFKEMYGEENSIICSSSDLSSIIPRIIKNNIKQF